ncbi:hypothetical protein DFH29DRAFT_438793 [Suillus ampliporus]|nr:hypothetical protein DFH29DRAFT_438793 [Suillus ampliporus]
MQLPDRSYSILSPAATPMTHQSVIPVHLASARPSPPCASPPTPSPIDSPRYNISILIGFLSGACRKVCGVQKSWRRIARSMTLIFFNHLVSLHFLDSHNVCSVQILRYSGVCESSNNGFVLKFFTRETLDASVRITALLDPGAEDDFRQYLS